MKQMLDDNKRSELDLYGRFRKVNDLLYTAHVDVYAFPPDHPHHDYILKYENEIKDIKRELQKEHGVKNFRQWFRRTRAYALYWKYMSISASLTIYYVDMCSGHLSGDEAKKDMRSLEKLLVELKEKIIFLFDLEDFDDWLEQMKRRIAHESYEASVCSQCLLGECLDDVKYDGVGYHLCHFYGPGNTREICGVIDRCEFFDK